MLIALFTLVSTAVFADNGEAYDQYEGMMCRGANWKGSDQGSKSLSDCRTLCDRQQTCSAFDIDDYSKCFLFETEDPQPEKTTNKVTCFIKNRRHLKSDVASMDFTLIARGLCETHVGTACGSAMLLCEGWAKAEVDATVLAGVKAQASLFASEAGMMRFFQQSLGAKAGVDVSGTLLGAFNAAASAKIGVSCDVQAVISLLGPAYVYQGQVTVNLKNGHTMTAKGGQIVTKKKVAIEAMNIHIDPCFERDIEYSGGDISSKRVDRFTDCQLECLKNEQCKYWTWYDSMCHLKGSTSGKAYFYGRTSGKKYCSNLCTDENEYTDKGDYKLPCCEGLVEKATFLGSKKCVPIANNVMVETTVSPLENVAHKPIHNVSASPNKCGHWLMFKSCENDAGCCPESNWTCGKDKHCVWRHASLNEHLPCDELEKLSNKMTNWMTSMLCGAGSMTCDNKKLSTLVCSHLGFHEGNPLTKVCIGAASSVLGMACSDLPAVCNEKKNKVADWIFSHVSPQCQHKENRCEA